MAVGSFLEEDLKRWNDNWNRIYSRTVLHSDLQNVKLRCSGDFILNEFDFQKKWIIHFRFILKMVQIDKSQT